MATHWKLTHIFQNRLAHFKQIPSESEGERLEVSLQLHLGLF